MLTWLLSLAVAAAASPALNVTLTNTLVGTTTVRVTGAGLRVAATLGADNTLFHARYREVRVADGRTTITRQSPRPHHAGTASGDADGVQFTDGRATAVIEHGRLKSFVGGPVLRCAVRRPAPYSGAAPPPPPPPPPNPFRATPSSRGESSYARRERLSRQMDL